MNARRLLAAALLAASLAAAAPPARAADPYQEASLALGQGLVALFPPAEGYVVSVDGGDAWVDLAERDLIRPGMELQVYRPGEPMVHPVSGQVLGSSEKTLGVLRVAEVRERYSRGTILGEPAAVAPGDRVRVSARRLTALLHVSGEAPGIDHGALAIAVAGRAAESGRFTVVDEPAWAGHLPAGGPGVAAAGADTLRRLGEKASADLLLLVEVSPGGERPALLATVRSLRTGGVVGELREPWPAAPAPAPVAVAPPPARPAAPPEDESGESAPPARPAPPAATPTPAPDEYATRELTRPAVHLAAGDFAGDGAVAVALSDGRGIALYRWDAQRLAWLWDEEGRRARRVLSLDAGDVDGDGRAELLVTAADRGRVRSELLAWRGGAFAAVADVDGIYLRFAGVRPGGGARLLGQRAGVDEVFSGGVEEYRLRDGRIEPAGGAALPRPAALFGLVLPPAPGPAAAFALDRAGKLLALGPRGEALWQSARPYGGYPPLAEERDLFGPGVLDEVAFDEAILAFQGRLLAEAHPAGVRIAVPRNFTDSPVLLVRQRSIGRGEVVLLAGTGAVLDEVARSRAFDGYVADLARVDVDRDGSAEILFAVNRRSGLFGDRGRLVLWRPPPVAANPAQKR